jgi:hypothetical protein
MITAHVGRARERKMHKLDLEAAMGGHGVFCCQAFVPLLKGDEAGGKQDGYMAQISLVYAVPANRQGPKIVWPGLLYH